MNFLVNFWYIFIALFCLGFSIFIHELGHFIAAKKRGLIADRFSIGFGPRICGWNWKGTDFRISLLPLGGYVSLPQLADMGRLEGGDKEEDPLPPISYTDKMIVAVMGAVFNIILAFFISLVLWYVGRDIIKSTQVDIVAEEIVNSDEQVVPGPAFVAGIQVGDEIQRIDGQQVGDWMQLMNAVMTSTGRSADGRPQVEIEFLRNGETQSAIAYPELISSEAIRALGLQPDSNLVVTQVQRDMPAAAAGMKIGDIPIALNGEAIESSAFLQLFLKNHQGGSVDVTVLRDGEEITLPIEPVIAKGEDRLRFGFGYYYDAKKVRVHRNPVEQLGIMANTMRMTLYALVHKGSDVKVRNMSGPVGIVDGLSTMARYGWVDLIWFLALINVNLALFNLLPIPVLDGGHMMFATISKVSGRKLPRKLMENVQGAFVLLLLGFVVYVSFFDVSRITERIGIFDTENSTVESAEPGSTGPDSSEPETE